MSMGNVAGGKGISQHLSVSRSETSRIQHAALEKVQIDDDRFQTGALLYVLAVAATKLVAVAQTATVAKQSAAAQALPAPDVYQIEPDHSFAYFGAWHHIIGLVRGRFDKVGGTFTVSRDPKACSVDVTIDDSSISTQNTERDEDLRSHFYFDVKNFPAITYRGTGIRLVSGRSWIMDGALTIHGVTKTVPLAFTFKGSFTDVPPGRPPRVAFHGSAATKRALFGIGDRDNAEEVGALLAPDVEIQIDIEADEKTSDK